MKKRLWLLLIISLLGMSSPTIAADLLEVYQQSLVSDPTFQQAIAQELSTGQGVPISRSYLLPNIGMTATPFLSRTTGSGPAARVQGVERERGYTIVLTATQTLFNAAQYFNFIQANAIAKQAMATLNAASQDLMIRVANAYFKILEDEDILRASESAKVAFSKQLDQATQQYKVGLKTLTDVYTAQASYEGSVADYIATEKILNDDRENLRAITGILYKSLATLSPKFPLITPKPTHMETWVATALLQNWSIIADRYALDAARQNIKQQFAGHIPTLNMQGTYEIDFIHDLGNNSSNTVDNTFNPPGPGQTHTTTIALNLTVPIFQGGLVASQTQKAKYDFQVAAQQLEFQIRASSNETRQSYMGVIAGISKIQADIQTIKSAKSSLAGMEAGYRVGTEILVNVLNQQQQVLTDEKIYAHDRYTYVNNLLALKRAAGTLSPDDLAAINRWLIDTNHEITTETTVIYKK